MRRTPTPGTVAEVRVGDAEFCADVPGMDAAQSPMAPTSKQTVSAGECPAFRATAPPRSMFYPRVSAAITLLEKGDLAEAARHQVQEVAHLVRSRLKDDEGLVDAAVEGCRAEIAVLRQAVEEGLNTSVHIDLDEAARHEPSQVHLEAMGHLRLGQINPQDVTTINHVVEVLTALLHIAWWTQGGGALEDLV